MQCYVYRSRRKVDIYLYLPRKDQFTHLPKALLDLFGKPEFALEFELTADRRLAGANAKEVLRRIKARGFYLQIPTESDSPV